MPGACCPRRAGIRTITVGDQSVGISQLDDILRAARLLGDQAEGSVKEFLMRQLKIYNYIPSGSEREYLNAVWHEYVKLRSVDLEVKR